VNILDSKDVVIVGNLEKNYPKNWRHSRLFEAISYGISKVLRTDEEMPFNGIIVPGMTIVIKPNFVAEENHRIPGEWESVLTHPAVIAIIAFQAAVSLAGKGKLIIADAPMTGSSMKKILSNTGIETYLEQLRSFFPSLDISLLDLRREEWNTVNGTVVRRRKLKGDPKGYALCNLAEKSLFANQDNSKLYGADYDVSELRVHHNNFRHEYLISKTILEADFVINLSKMKTHKKGGVTLALKNFVGINGDKNYLPHHKEGTPSSGGDEFPIDSNKVSLERKSVSIYRKTMLKIPYPFNVPFTLLKRFSKGFFGDSDTTIRGGSWWGNDTIWRMTLDIQRAFLYARPDGTIADTPQRSRYLCISDGIIAGEGAGPTEPTPKPFGVMAFAVNPVAHDFVCTKLMGFDPARIPTITRAFSILDLPLIKSTEESILLSSYDASKDFIHTDFEGLISRFEPYIGWKSRL